MTTVVVIAVVLLLLLAALRLWLTATRLDRLHSRTEAAWMALESALARRIVASRAVAAAGGLDPADAERLRRLADAADGAVRAHRADAENDLSRGLATLTTGADPHLAAELADASERVVLARRFYNDAVRDTRALRAVLFTRIFRLAGRAALPDYFEIAEARPQAAPNGPARPQTASNGPARPHAAAGGSAGAPVGTLPAPPVRRLAARVVLLDDDDRVLLLTGSDPGTGTSPWWMTPGGGVEDGEDLAAAAVRELAEETGVALTGADLVGPIWRRTARFVFTGIDYEQTEFYFAARTPPASGNGHGGAAITAEHRTDVEQQVIIGHRWWAGADLTDSADEIYPVELPARLPEVRAALATRVAPAAVPEVR